VFWILLRLNIFCTSSVTPCYATKLLIILIYWSPFGVTVTLRTLYTCYKHFKMIRFWPTLHLPHFKGSASDSIIYMCYKHKTQIWCLAETSTAPVWAHVAQQGLVFLETFQNGPVFFAHPVFSAFQGGWVSVSLLAWIRQRAMASLGWVTSEAATEGVTPLFFSW